MENTLGRIAKCRYKTKIDKRSGFWQVDLTAAAQELLAFITPQGRVFEWKIMPLGVAYASALFQEMLNKILYILRRRPLAQELISRGAQEPGASPRAAAAAEGSRESARGDATAATASRATASAGHAAAPSTPRKRGTDPARATGGLPAAAAAAALGREGAKYRAHANPTRTHTSPPKLFPPKVFPPGRTRHVHARAPERSPPGVILFSCKGSGTPGA